MIDLDEYFSINHPDYIEDGRTGSYKFKNNNKMNKVNISDVTFMSLALADFTAVTTYLVAHDYAVAGGLLVAGVILVYLYHKFGSTTV